MGVPDMIPKQIYLASSGFSYTDSDAFDFICALDEAAPEHKGSHPYIELRFLVVAFTGWFGISRATIVTTNALHLTLKLGRYYYQLKPVKVLCCLSVPCFVYLDAPLPEIIRGNYTKETIHDLLRLFFQIKLMTLWRPSIFQCLLPLQRITDSARCNPTSMDSIRYVVCPLNSGLC